MEREIILAIETGIGGGSISLLEKGSEIDFWEGTERIAKSEELLSNVSNLLQKNSLSKKDIKNIAVSRGPGSFTGVRTGIAAAKGLQKALQCACKGVSALEALVLRAERPGIVTTGFPAGKNEICWQMFEFDGGCLIKNLNSPQISSINDFIPAINKQAVVVFYKNFLEAFEDAGLDFRNIEVLNIEDSAAKYIGLRSGQVSPDSEILPLYARDSNVG